MHYLIVNVTHSVTAVKMKVDAPKGYHWMKQSDGSLKLMQHKDKFVPHKGASLKANFSVQKAHNGTRKKSKKS